MRPVLYSLLLLLIPLGAYSQTYNPRVVCNLPNSIAESSGIIVDAANLIWTHNDGGAAAQIYQVDTNGTLIRTVDIIGFSNIDWEDICRDQNGFVYIGDFGNNNNARQNLRILKIDDPAQSSADSAQAQLINFSFEDQNAFPPPASQQNFDCEAFFHCGDSLYLFSKNRGTSDYCKMYRLPDDSGTYVAQLIDSFDTQRWITAADISPDKTRMLLLSENIIHVFRNYSGTSFYKGDYIPINISLTQKEAIAFIDNDVVYITDELLFTIGRKLYEIDIDAIINSIDGISGPISTFNLFPNPSSGMVQIFASTTRLEQIHGSVITANGKTVHEFNFQSIPPHTLHFIDLSELSAGMYHVVLSGKYGAKAFPIIRY